MQVSTSSTFTVGPKNSITFPQGLMKNLAKFQGINLASLVLGSQSELLERRQTQRGCVLGPFTSIFSIMGKLALKFSFTKPVISSGVPFSWLLNWLQGKARISNPLFFHFSCAFTNSVQFSDVSPHLQATLTIMINFLFLRELRSKSLPEMSLTLKSKKLLPPWLANPSLPDLKKIFATRPPIRKNNIINLLLPGIWFYATLFLTEICLDAEVRKCSQPTKKINLGRGNQGRSLSTELGSSVRQHHIGDLPQFKQVSSFEQSLLLCSLLEALLNVREHLLHLHLGAEELNHFSLRVDEEFREIPGNQLGLFGFGVIERAVGAEVGVERMCVGSIYLYLLHNGEAGVEIFLHESGDFLGGAIFLAEELVAREGKNLESTALPLFMRLHHFLIVFGCESSLASDVDHHDQLLVPEGVEIKVFAHDISNFEVKEAGASFAGQALAP